MSGRQSPPERNVARVLDPRFEAGRVQGHHARRLIDGVDATATDPFVLMAEDFMPRDAFGQHPHRGIETVTLVLEGAVEHFDSAGNRGLIKAGDAQWMTAGRGIIHNENAVAGSIAHSLQLLGQPAGQQQDDGASIPGPARCGAPRSPRARRRSQSAVGAIRRHRVADPQSCFGDGAGGAGRGGGVV